MELSYEDIDNMCSYTKNILIKLNKKEVES